MKMTQPMMQQKTQSMTQSMTHSITQSMTQQTRQSRHPVQKLHEPTVSVSVGLINRGFAALSALPLLQCRRWWQVAACDDVLMQRVDAKLAVETGCHDQA
jgi:hypothetical protein